MKHNLLVTVFSVMLMFAFGAQAGVFSDDVSAAYSKKDNLEDSRSNADKKREKGSEDSESSDDNKVTLCHAPPGSPENLQTLSVAEGAVAAHLAHGDLLGACPVVEPPDSVKPARGNSQRTIYGQ
ncbi:hypothetical protein F3F96_03230 [Mariprofundus sp. NF]|uniref:hypothetical protein n=1 Tax=Mariprofundus sp. NF TaxID=2608716 RepID=UPI0015A0CBE5|nr:hypothetical protein [Mariprofundus sp. NF]NWF38149.1 hypothetical protein [Mariprofundus sp. NF]